ncbi:PTS transporter subunit EIIB, partial [Vibrio parahaemolyticus]|nr:PTS transporter subunit EIIB [Vibrio parahaemolyticus]
MLANAPINLSSALWPNPNVEQDVDTIIAAIGGLDNVVETGACATRLRLTL